MNIRLRNVDQVIHFDHLSNKKPEGKLHKLNYKLAIIMVPNTMFIGWARRW